MFKAFIAALLLSGLSFSLAFAQLATGTNASKLYEQAMTYAAKAENGQAIPLFIQASDLYTAEKNAEGAYKSAALAIVLKEEDVALKSNQGMPVFFRSSWLLADPLYSAQFTTPPVKPAAPFGGLLVLSREVRRIQTPGGGSRPIWGVVDAQAVPALQPGEAFAPDPGPCGLLSGAPDAGVAALVKVKGHEGDSVWKDIRKAWRFNHKNSRIEDISPTQVFCQNETLGS